MITSKSIELIFSFLGLHRTRDFTHIPFYQKNEKKITQVKKKVIGQSDKRVHDYKALLNCALPHYTNRTMSIHFSSLQKSNLFSHFYWRGYNEWVPSLWSTVRNNFIDVERHITRGTGEMLKQRWFSKSRRWSSSYQPEGGEKFHSIQTKCS